MTKRKRDMGKIFLVVIGVLIAGQAFADNLPITRIIEPVVKQEDYTTGEVQSSVNIWIPADIDGKRNIVLDGFFITSNTDAIVTLAASSTIVKVRLNASEPTVNNPNFLWRGTRNEVINVTTETGLTGLGQISLSLTGWEEE